VEWTHRYSWRSGPPGAGGPAAFNDNPVRAALCGQRCRILARDPRCGTVLIVTDGGWTGTTSLRALRRLAKEAA